MLTAQQRILKLQEAIALLQDVDALQQTAIADVERYSEACYELHNELDNIIDTLEEAIEELESEDTDPGYLDSDAHLGQVE